MDEDVGACRQPWGHVAHCEHDRGKFQLWYAQLALLCVPVATGVGRVQGAAWPEVPAVALARGVRIDVHGRRRRWVEGDNGVEWCIQKV